MLAATLLLLLVCGTALRVDHCIVGAGPGGLQMARLLHDTRGTSYVVLEAAAEPASFFSRFPRARRLISINKRHTGAANDSGFAWRHDWNSLLGSATLRMGQFSRDLYPHADDLRRYLRAFAEPLRVRYNFTVARVDRVATGFVVNSGAVECARSLVVATGFSLAHVPSGLQGAHLAHSYLTVPLDPLRYTNRSVLFVGNGNSAFESANVINDETALIHVGARQAVQLSYFTHYVGHARAVNNRLLDHYQLKSLDALFELDADRVTLYRRVDGRIGVYEREADEAVPLAHESEQQQHGDSLRCGYDHVILATGWRSNQSLFESGNVRPQWGSKYPEMTAGYESANESDVFFAGALMHAHDWRKSAGGFIHGFRYLVRCVHQLMMLRYHAHALPHTKGRGMDSLRRHLLARINDNDAAYQMFGVIGDVAVLGRCGEQEAEEEEEVSGHGIKCEPRVVTTAQWIMYHDVLLRHLAAYPFAADPAVRLLLVFFDYGPFHRGPSVLSSPIAGEAHPKDSGFLHPILREIRLVNASSVQVQSELHLLEDFLTLFDTPELHVKPLDDYLRVLRVCGTHWEPPAEVLTPSAHMAPLSREQASAQLAMAGYENSQMAQRLLKLGRVREARVAAELALALWGGVDDAKCVPLLVFVAVLSDREDETETRLREAVALTERLHAPAQRTSILWAHVVATMRLADSSGADQAAARFWRKHFPSAAHDEL